MKNPFALLVLIVFPVIAVTLSSCSDDIYCPNQQPTEQAKWSTHITMDQAKKRLINIVSEINNSDHRRSEPLTVTLCCIIRKDAMYRAG